MEKMIVEVLNKTDLLSIAVAREFMINVSSMNIITITDSVDIIREFIFGKDVDSELLTNFIIKADSMLSMNDFYTLFTVSFEKPKDGWFKAKSNTEELFVVNHMRFFIAIRFFAEVFILNLREEVSDEQ